MLNENLSLKKSITILKELAKEKIVLVVEDDEFIVNSLHRMLDNFFTDIYKTTNVDDAIAIYRKIFQSKIPIVVITDINLGEKSGIDLTYILKKINPKQKVIAISGTEKREVFIESIRCGVDRFVLKPIDLEDLFNSLIAILHMIEYDLELKKSQKLLEDSKEYALKLLAQQDQFLKNAIHEIYTPLAVIITNIDLLRIQEIENDSIDSIEAGARIIQNSYEDMTYLMKKDRIEYQKATICPVEFITQRVNYFACIAEVNGLSISMRVGCLNIPSIYFSEPKLCRLVDNTLSNAIKYATKLTQISVMIGMYNENIFFEVRNYGTPIQEKEKIFERFYRETKEKGGYGLGLNIVAGICKEEDIDIDVSSSHLGGTSFRYVFRDKASYRENLK